MKYSSHTSKIQLLRNCGLRPTLPRIATMLTLEHGGGQPLCFYDISRRLPPFGIRASASTVQRVLTELEMRGLVQRTSLDGRSYYQPSWQPQEDLGASLQ